MCDQACDPAVQLLRELGLSSRTVVAATFTDRVKGGEEEVGRRLAALEQALRQVGGWVAEWVRWWVRWCVGG